MSDIIITAFGTLLSLTTFRVWMTFGATWIFTLLRTSASSPDYLDDSPISGCMDAQFEQNLRQSGACCAKCFTILDSRHDSELLELRAHVRNTAHHKARRLWAACNSAAPRHSQIFVSPAQARVVTVEAPPNKIALQRAPEQWTTSESMIALTRACTVKLIRVLFPRPMSNTSHAVQNLCCSPPIGQNC